MGQRLFVLFSEKLLLSLSFFFVILTLKNKKTKQKNFTSIGNLLSLKCPRGESTNRATTRDRGVREGEVTHRRSNLVGLLNERGGRICPQIGPDRSDRSGLADLFCHRNWSPERFHYFTLTRSQLLNELNKAVYTPSMALESHYKTMLEHGL